MPQIISKKEEPSLGVEQTKNQLSTEEEVKILKEELAKKEKELALLQEQPIEKDKIKEEKTKEKEIRKEKEKIRISPDNSSRVKLSQKFVKTNKAKKLDDDIAADLKQIMSMDKPRQVKTLVYLAFKKGVNYAANIANQLKDPYLLDEFHDTLVDNLYDLLKKKKKI
jgi:hypothetical protein